MKTIAVFCGSGTGADPIYMEEAKKLGEAISAAGIKLVYGGASVGCMGAVADAVIDGGGEVIGVMPKKLFEAEMAHARLTKLHIVENMHERKALMAEHADGFMALPGGIGTLEEWFEVFTWSQIGYHDKPCALLNVNGYYEPLLSMFDHMIDQGFVKFNQKDVILTDKDSGSLVQKLVNYKSN
ncbi:TIGR00730 family Rossman fold protein [Salipaludibacillus keqinensis]|uniref:Cytokinin riboside 5'-monophosphate phosphoribohydrolase n=1 Tax=Salipaludibacillus keqinensis TaxID=2045207 RepID=A0A323TCM3_9BACI|nr:TIGR00730 family Rossman fold protein [Salipaludibacillus keqinensis]PYZ91944.1 TIGR00730 family Rossman fold protein [Salipaludibacillus keqinensis]